MSTGVAAASPRLLYPRRSRGVAASHQRKLRAAKVLGERLDERAVVAAHFRVVRAARAHAGLVQIVAGRRLVLFKGLVPFARGEHLWTTEPVGPGFFYVLHEDDAIIPMPQK